jgi:hypothetical protein
MTRPSTTAELRALVAQIPDPPASVDEAAIAHALDDEVAWLESAEARASLAVDVYWPKGRSPWWSMLLLHELGATARIPSRIVDALVDGLRRMPLYTFPIAESDWPPGIVDRARASMCHCALGCIDQLLTASGVDVDRALPWFAPWYARYQMADGGYNCDESAYFVTDEIPSSMVGTIAPFEAMLGRAPSEACDRAAAFLVARQLRLGSSTRHNADERISAERWGELCFPRFYFYDVLRGLAALVRWAILRARPLPLGAIADVVGHLAERFPDGRVRIGRAPIDGMQTRAPDADGNWVRRPADLGPLLVLVSRPGSESAPLTRRWAAARRDLLTLVDAGQITDG